MLDVASRRRLHELSRLRRTFVSRYRHLWQRATQVLGLQSSTKQQSRSCTQPDGGCGDGGLHAGGQGGAGVRHRGRRPSRPQCERSKAEVPSACRPARVSFAGRPLLPPVASPPSPACRPPHPDRPPGCPLLPPVGQTTVAARAQAWRRPVGLVTNVRRLAWTDTTTSERLEAENNVHLTMSELDGCRYLRRPIGRHRAE